LFGIIKMTMGLRVDEDEEVEGLDLGEHGMHGYDVGLGGTNTSHAVALEPEEEKAARKSAAAVSEPAAAEA
jgi:hypothetical protein